MKSSLLVACSFVVFSLPTTHAQTASQLAQCKKAISDTPLSPDMCSLIASSLQSDESIVTVTDSGSFMTVTPDGRLHNHSVSPKLQSTLLLNTVTRTIKRAEQFVPTAPKSIAAIMLPGWLDYWAQIRDAYCSYHPGDSYIDLSNTEQVCTNTVATGDPKKFPQDLLNGVSVVELNLTSSMIDESVLHPRVNDAATSAAMAAPVATSVADAVHPLRASASPSGVQKKPRSGCQKAITFSQAVNRLLVYRLPDISHRELGKLQKKYPNVCFPQYKRESGAENYLVVLSSSASTFSGFQPVFRTDTTTTPVSGSGTVTDNAGATWNYTYDGTATTTTTTETNVAYTDTTSHLYASAYGQDGTLVANGEKSRGYRQGGDPYNALGYNLTSSLLSIHTEQHLLANIVRKISLTP